LARSKSSVQDVRKSDFGEGGGAGIAVEQGARHTPRTSSMPRYFFDLHDHKRDADDEGTELANDDEARVQAIIFTGDYLRDHPQLVSNGSRFRVALRDEADAVLLNVVVTAEDRCVPRD
jgi:hypothetical protein